MAIERYWEAVAPVAFIADGGADGTITLSSTAGFKVKQSVVVSAISLPNKDLEVKKVLSATKLIVGPVVTTGKLIAREDLSLYTVASSATIRAAEQKKALLPPNDIIQAVYEQEPAVAIRTLPVNQLGNPTTNMDGSYNVNVLNKFFKKPFDDIQLTYDPVTQEIVQAESYYQSALVETLEFTYDEYLNLIRVRNV